MNVGNVVVLALIGVAFYFNKKQNDHSITYWDNNGEATSLKKRDNVDVDRIWWHQFFGSLKWLTIGLILAIAIYQQFIR